MKKTAIGLVILALPAILVGFWFFRVAKEAAKQEEAFGRIFSVPSENGIPVSVYYKLGETHLDHIIIYKALIQDWEENVALYETGNADYSLIEVDSAVGRTRVVLNPKGKRIAIEDGGTMYEFVGSKMRTHRISISNEAFLDYIHPPIHNYTFESFLALNPSNTNPLE